MKYPEEIYIRLPGTHYDPTRLPCGLKIEKPIWIIASSINNALGEYNLQIISEHNMLKGGLSTASLQTHVKKGNNDTCCAYIRKPTLMLCGPIKAIPLTPLPFTLNDLIYEKTVTAKNGKEVTATIVNTQATWDNDIDPPTPTCC